MEKAEDELVVAKRPKHIGWHAKQITQPLRDVEEHLNFFSLNFGVLFVPPSLNV